MLCTNTKNPPSKAYCKVGWVGTRTMEQGENNN